MCCCQSASHTLCLYSNLRKAAQVVGQALDQHYFNWKWTKMKVRPVYLGSLDSGVFSGSTRSSFHLFASKGKSGVYMRSVRMFVTRRTVETKEKNCNFLHIAKKGQRLGGVTHADRTSSLNGILVMILKGETLLLSSNSKLCANYTKFILPGDGPEARCEQHWDHDWCIAHHS